MSVKKITDGYVIQTFENGRPVSQEFIAGDSCDYEDENGKSLRASDQRVKECEFLPFDMVQPDGLDDD